MKKIIIAIIFIVFFNIIVMAQSGKTELIFESSVKSVVYIEKAIYFDEAKVKYAYLFKRIEKKYAIKILNEYIYVSAGSGFLISDDGFLITNNHVVNQKESEKEVKETLFKGLDKYLLRPLIDRIYEYSDYVKLKNDIKHIISTSKFVYHIKIENRKDYTATLLLSDKDLDVALLKINDPDSVFYPLPLADSDETKVGNSVIAIGYPRPDLFNYFFTQFRSTITAGIISSLRDDNWGIQHTASIDHGNSGGPLLNQEGKVIGINTAMFNNVNNVYFAIPINRLTNWIENHDRYSFLIKKNKEQGLELGIDYSLNDEGYLETGPSILINTKRGIKIYLDNKFIGKTPYLLKLSQGKHNLRLELKNKQSKQKILVDPSITNIFTYSPRMGENTGSISVTTTPKGATVYIDGVKKGITPFQNDFVRIGEHSIRLSYPNYFPQESKINITKNKLTKYNHTLKKGYILRFKNKLPEDTTITAKNETDKHTFKQSDTILLKKGNWDITIINKNFEDFTTSINITGNEEIDFTPKFHIGKIKFKNLRQNASVYIDGEERTQDVTNDQIYLTVGNYDISVKLKNKRPFNKSVVVEKDKATSIAITYPISMARLLLYKNGSSALIAGSILTSEGFILLPIGIAVGLNITPNDYTINTFNSALYATPYAQYITEKKAYIAMFAVGLSLTILSIGFLSAAIPLRILYRKHKTNTKFFLDMKYKNNSAQVGIKISF